MIEVCHIRAFSSNYIWVISPTGGDDVWLVDPGQAEPCLQWLDQNHKNLAGILVTHHHQDHTGGIQELQTGSLPVYGPGDIGSVTHALNDGDEVQIGPALFSVLAVPGHTLDHLAYYTTANVDPTLFCGDTLFSAGCGRLFEGTPQQLLTSLHKLAAFPDNTRVYCTHEYTLDNLRFAREVEPENSSIHALQQTAQTLIDRQQPTLPSNIALEKSVNPFLRAKNQSIMHRVETELRLTIETELECFTQLRRWKDRF